MEWNSIVINTKIIKYLHKYYKYSVVQEKLKNKLFPLLTYENILMFILLQSKIS